MRSSRIRKKRRPLPYMFFVKFAVVLCLFLFTLWVLKKESDVWFSQPRRYVRRYQPKQSILRKERAMYEKMKKEGEALVIRSRASSRRAADAQKDASEPSNRRGKKYKKPKKSEAEIAQEHERMALEFGFNTLPRPNRVLTVVDRVEQNIVVVSKPVEPESNYESCEDIYISGSRFGVLPIPGDYIVIDTQTDDVITPNIGKILICQVRFVASGPFGTTEFHTFTYREKCKLSGLYNNPNDRYNVLRARKKIYKAARNDEITLRKKRPKHNVYIQSTIYYTDAQPDKEALTSFVRYVSYDGEKNNKIISAVSPLSDKIPNIF